MVNLDEMFLFNLAADALVLFLIRADAFPEIQDGRVWWGAVLAAFSYTVWYGVVNGKMGGWECPSVLFFLIKIFWAAGNICLLLVWIFRAYTPFRFLQAVFSGAGRLFLLGGFGYCLKSALKEETYLLMAMAGLTVVLLLQKKKNPGWSGEEDNTYEVEICRKGHRIRQRGWYDSGNLLVSQVTGRGVCILALEEAWKLIDDEEKAMLQYVLAQEEFPWKAMTEHLWSGVCPVSYSSLGKKDGWLPGIYVDQILVKRNAQVLAEVKGLIGISAEKLFVKGRFSVLLPADIFRK